MRAPNFKPKQDKFKASRSQKSWYISVPPGLSTTGERRRLFFWTLADAVQEAQGFRQQMRQQGNSQYLLHHGQRVEASEAYELLEEKSIKTSLLTIVKQYIDQQEKRQQSKELGELFEKYFKDKQHLSFYQRRDIKNCQKHFPHHMETLACDLDGQQIEDELSKETLSMFNKYRAALNSVLNHAVKKGWIESNPLVRIHKKKKPKRYDDEDDEVQILPPEQIEAMLQDALVNDPALLPYLVLGFFTGARVMEEVCRIRWKYIKDGLLIIPKNISKTGKSRIIPLEPNALQWLAVCQHTTGTGIIVPFNYYVADRRRDALCKRLGITYPRNAMRHSCASYTAKIIKSEIELCSRMGPDIKVLWNNYITACTEAEAKRFFSIVPPVD